MSHLLQTTEHKFKSAKGKDGDRGGSVEGRNEKLRKREEWAETLAQGLSAAAESGEPDNGSHYYHHWLTALERLVTVKGLTDPAASSERKETWAEAYRHTPHGKPVELSAATRTKQT